MMFYGDEIDNLNNLSNCFYCTRDRKLSVTSNNLYYYVKSSP